MLKGNELPAAPSGDRILVQTDPPGDKIGRIWIPDIAKLRAHTGVIVHAGLKALDTMYDNDHRIGDRVWWGQFAGVIEKWDHITKPGRNPKCEHNGHGDDHGAQWESLPCDVDMVRLWTCRDCAAERREEPLKAMNVEDIIANETAEERRRSGEVEVCRGVNADGQTTHYIRRRGDSPVKITKGDRNAAA